MGDADNPGGHAFISYVREDSREVDRLQRVLESAGIRVWRDTVDLWPGEDWRVRIRQAITSNALVFIACFSHNSATRAKSYQNQELALAVDQLVLRQPGMPWLIPVRFDDRPAETRGVQTEDRYQIGQRLRLWRDSLLRMG